MSKKQFARVNLDYHKRDMEGFEAAKYIERK